MQNFQCMTERIMALKMSIGNSHLENTINKKDTINSTLFASKSHKFLSSLIFNMIRLQILTTIYFLYFSGVLALPTIDDNEITNEDNANNGDEEKETCDEIFANNGMNYSTFYEGAAHGIHSLRLSIMLCIYIYNA